jgi:aspartyl/asparaginyl-tRNA synthetase
MITDFPNYTSPFWNMKQNGDGTAAKIDVIIEGQETIGSAERSSNPDEMSEMFHTISDGGYANLLYSKFGKERVEAELDEFLKYDFFPRVGGGIGVTRMIRALEMNND